MYEHYDVNRKPFYVIKKAVPAVERSGCSLLPYMNGVTNARTDFQHKLSRIIVDKKQAIIVGTLKKANTMKNHNLARAIGDAGGAGFIIRPEYKVAEKRCSSGKV